MTTTQTDELLIERADGEDPQKPDAVYEWVEVGRHPVSGRTYVATSRREWENLEEELVRQYLLGKWEPGHYRVTLTWTYSGRTTVIEREMPLHPFYAKLPYFKGTVGTDAPAARAYLHTLLRQYPGTTLHMIAEHYQAFDAHYQIKISTAELTERTGYALPDGTQRPWNVYQNEYNSRDEIPDHLQ